MKNEDAVRAVSDFVNNMGNSNADFIAAWRREHRTLQQSFTKLCVEWLEECAKMHDEGDFDGRNEASCKLGKMFVDRLDRMDRALPLI